MFSSICSFTGGFLLLSLIMGSYLERAKQLNTLNIAQMLQPRSLAASQPCHPGPFLVTSLAMTQEPMKIGGTHYYKAFVSGLCLCKGMVSTIYMAKNMVQYLHFRILKFPLVVAGKVGNCLPCTLYAWVGLGGTGFTFPNGG